mgnify:CR=1 FL=1
MSSENDKTAQILEDARLLQAGKDPTKVKPSAEIPPAAPDAPAPQEPATPADLTRLTGVFVTALELYAIKQGGQTWKMPAEIRTEMVTAGAQVLAKYLPMLQHTGPEGALIGCTLAWVMMAKGDEWMSAPSPPLLDGADPAKAA